jgi:hypothetical protein
MTSTRSPEDLCRALGIVADEQQSEVMRRFYEGQTPLDLENDLFQANEKAAAVCFLWLLLRTPQSIGTVLAENEADSLRFMSYLYHLTQGFSTVLSSITRMPTWKQLTIEGRRDWQIRVMPHNVFACVERSKKSTFGVIIGAKGSELSFLEASKALEKSLLEQNKPLIRIW